jgi:DNA-binding IclR family transcriptional regulator
MRNYRCSCDEFFPCSLRRSLPETAQDYVDELADELGVSRNLVAFSLLGITAAAQVGETCEVASEFTVGQSLYFVGGAPPSSGKTPILERLKGPYEAAIQKHLLLTPEETTRLTTRANILRESIKRVTRQASKVKTREERMELEEKLSELTKELEQCKVPVSLLMGKSTIQAIPKELFVRGESAAQLSAEGGLFTALETVSPSQLTPLLSAWSNELIEDITKKERIVVKKPSLVTVSLWQPGPLLKVFQRQEYRDNGLIARCLPFVEADSFKERYLRRPRSEKSKRWYLSLQDSLLQRRASCLKLANALPQYHLASQARDVWQRFKEHTHMLQERDAPFEHYRDIAGKLDMQAIRLAMVLHVLEYGVSGNDSKKSIEIAEGTMLYACNLALFFGYESVRIINDAHEEKLWQAALPLTTFIASVQDDTPRLSSFTVEELCEPTGFSQSKCKRILHWFCEKGWMDRRSMKSRRSENGLSTKPQVLWEPRCHFSDLL